MPTPESKLKADVLEYLGKTGMFFRRMHSGQHRVKRGFIYLGPMGTADFLVCPPQRPPVWIELKAPNMKTAKEREQAQAAFAEQVRQLGHECAICRSVEDVANVLKLAA